MPHRRSALEIYLTVLWIIKRGTTKPTRIMYEANLSWIPLQNVLASLVSQGLVMEIESGDRGDRRTTKTYRITPKGENVIQYFRRAKELLPLEIFPNWRSI